MVTSYILQGRDISEMAKLAQPPPPTEEDEGPTQVWSLNIIFSSFWPLLLNQGNCINEILGGQIDENIIALPIGQFNEPSSGITILLRSSKQLPHCSLDTVLFKGP